MTEDERHLLLGLYDWCVRETEKEIDNDCETLRCLNNLSASAYVEFIAAQESKSCAKAAGLALVKRFNLPVLASKKEMFTAWDQQIVNDFINFARFKRFGAKLPVVLNAKEKVRKGDLSKKTRLCLDEHLGQPAVDPDGLLKYATVVGPFELTTYIDFGGRVPLRYSHKIIAQKRRTIYESSLLHWHGIATETTWNAMNPKDIDRSIGLLVQLCQRFLAAIQVISRSP